MTKFKQYISGMRAGLPVIFGFIPVGIAFAITARQAGFTVLETQLMSLTVFAGASQMMAAKMWGEAAGIAAIVLATFIINIRHIIMSTCVMQRMKEAPLWARLLGAFGVTDESFAIFTSCEEDRCTPMYFFGLVTVTYSSWNIGTLLGALGADLLPDIVALSFGVALYAMFIAIVVPDIKGNLRLGLLVVFAGLSNWALGLAIDSGWAMIISTLVAAFVGVFFVELDGEDNGTIPNGKTGASTDNALTKSTVNTAQNTADTDTVVKAISTDTTEEKAKEDAPDVKA